SQAIKRINIVQSGTVVGKKELDQMWDVIHNAIIKAANQSLPRKKVLNTGCSRKKSRTKTDLKKSILDLGKNPRYRNRYATSPKFRRRRAGLKRMEKNLGEKMLIRKY
ncbi:5680_t:CDS:2, partial [Gigaspora rosea]